MAATHTGSAHPLRSSLLPSEPSKCVQSSRMEVVGSTPTPTPTTLFFSLPICLRRGERRLLERCHSCGSLLLRCSQAPLPPHSIPTPAHRPQALSHWQICACMHECVCRADVCEASVMVTVAMWRQSDDRNAKRNVFVRRRPSQNKQRQLDGFSAPK